MAKLSDNFFYGEKMEQIILSTNLRFVTAGLSAEQKGELFQALLEQNGEALVGEAQNLYQYITALQQEFTEKKRRMKELSTKAVAARQKTAETGELFGENLPAVTDGAPTVHRADKKRKEAKENILNINKKIKKIFISSAEKTQKTKMLSLEVAEEAAKQVPFVSPLVDDVRAFVVEEKLCVNPEEFVDFYDSHGWKVGTTAIKNWKATVRLWHRRAMDDCYPHPPVPSAGGSASGSATCLTFGCGGERGITATRGLGRKGRKDDDETYWHELMEKTRAVTICPAPEPPPVQAAESVDTGEESTLPDDKNGLSPFARFMRRIEDNDE